MIPEPTWGSAAKQFSEEALPTGSVQGVGCIACDPAAGPPAVIYYFKGTAFCAGHRHLPHQNAVYG